MYRMGKRESLRQGTVIGKMTIQNSPGEDSRILLSVITRIWPTPRCAGVTNAVAELPHGWRTPPAPSADPPGRTSSD